MLLPSDLLKLIDSFVDKFNFWESLPNPKKIHRLAQKSNQDLLTRLCLSFFLPPDFVTTSSFTFGFQLNSDNLKHIETALHGSVENCWQTSVLFWLFVEKKETIYHGCFTKIFEESLFYQLVNILSYNSNELIELGFLYLIKNRCTSEEPQYRLL